MARPYSEDIRERVVARIEGGASRREAAEHFDICPSSAIKWMQRLEKTGSCAAKPMGGCRPKKIVGQHRDWLLERCRVQDFTLRGLVAELAERGLRVDYRTVWEFVHGEKLSYKKRRWSPANATGPT